MTVYRIQDQEGRGPFRPGFSHRWLDEMKPNEHELVAWPVQFPHLLPVVMRSRFCYFGCACKSPDQLRRWFSISEMERLREFGYSAIKLKVDKILGESDVQLVFQRTKPLTQEVEPFELYEILDLGATEPTTESLLRRVRQNEPKGSQRPEAPPLQTTHYALLR